MAAEIYNAIARLRWPKADPVFGDGRFAMLSHCPERPFVRLFDSADAAKAARADCGHGFCKGDHKIFDLDKPAREPAPVPYRKKPHWSAWLNDND